MKIKIIVPPSSQVNRCCLLIVILTLISVVDAVSEFDECVGPSGKVGRCSPLLKCPELFRILQENPPNKDRVKFLQQSSCLFVNEDPWVCCPARELENNEVNNNSSKNKSVNDSQNSLKTGPDPLSPDVTAAHVKSDEEVRRKIQSHPNLKLLPTAQSCGVSLNSDRIVGGVEAGLGSFPWMALLGILDPSGGYQLACGGTLINSQYVLTAAHCVTKLPPGFKVSFIRLGEYDQRHNPDCDNGICAPKYQEIPVVELTPHEKYDSTGQYDNDIALIRLQRPAVLGAFVRPVCLPHGDVLRHHVLEPNNHTVVAGWGKIKNGEGDGSPVLQMVALPILSPQQCNEIFRVNRISALDETRFCAGGERGKDSCSGDSGGPLVQNVADELGGRTWQFGVVSYGPKKCGSSIPAVYTRITYYMPWILNVLKP